MKNKWTSRYFCGNEISPYGLENGYLDYATLAKAFPHILANNHLIINTEIVCGWWKWYNGSDKEENKNIEVLQWFIISERGAHLLAEYTDEIVFYNKELDMYLWGVTHDGTSWDYVLTDVKLDLCD